MEELSFDYVFHLAGEQILPNYMAIKLCKSARHLFLVSSKTEGHVARLQAEFPDRKVFAGLVDPFSYSASAAELASVEGNLAGRRVGFNVTGGTKIMFAAALDFCRKTGATPFYLDTQSRKIRFLGEGDAVLAMPPVFDDVATFVRLAGHEISRAGKTAGDSVVSAREPLVRRMETCARVLSRFVPKAAELLKEHGRSSGNRPGPVGTMFGEMLAHAAKKGVVDLPALWNAAFPAAEWKAALGFLAGEWFEESCFRRISSGGEFRDVRLNLATIWKDSGNRSKFDESQELDVACTDGYRLLVVECKSGAVRQEYAQKLENVVSLFGGSFGKGVLVSFHPCNPSIRARLSNSRNCRLLEGSGVADVSDVLKTLPF